jgi:hypothetical protein
VPLVGSLTTDPQCTATVSGRGETGSARGR